MSANPSYDIDALQRAQRAYEPSMEEILASIRNIISEERPGLGQLPNIPQGSKGANPDAAAPVVDNQAAPERIEPAASPRVVWPKSEAEAAAGPAPAPPALVTSRPPENGGAGVIAPVKQERLISPEADAAIAHSFDALSVSVAVQHSSIIQDTVRDMLRPMLKAWLDDHLPTMVENLVRAEIQRVARGGR
jgi:cell pole-organizing protein PopZ